MKIFISYSRMDFKIADAVFEKLDGQEHAPWLDVYSLKPGLPWKKQIINAITESDAIVIITSRYGLDSPFVGAEYRLANSLNKPILLVLIQDCTKKDLEAAFGPGFEEKQLDGRPQNPLYWIDARKHPLDIPNMVLYWVANHSRAHSGMPVGAKPSIFNYKNAPEAIHVAAWSLILISSIGIGIYIASGIWILPRITFALQGGQDLELDVLNIFALALIITSPFLIYYVRAGLYTYYRRENNPAARLKNLSTYLLIPSGFFVFILTLIFFTKTFLSSSWNVIDPFPSGFKPLVIVIFILSLAIRAVGGKL